MRLHGKNKDEDILGEELRKLALRAAATYLLKDDPSPGGSGDYRLTQVLSHSLPFDGCGEEKALVLEALFDDQNGAVRRLYRYDNAVAEIVMHLTAEFLTRALLDGDVQDYLRFRAFEAGSHFKNPLEGVCPQDLVNWCLNSGSDKAWVLTANAIAPFGSSREGAHPKLSGQAMALLEAAPNPTEVLDFYVDAVIPMSWSGSRVDIMAGRITALEELKSSDVNGIAAHLKKALPGLRKRKADERDREENQDRESEQRFE